MNQLNELRLHIDALSAAVEHNPQFFASIIHYVQRFKELLKIEAEELSQDELKILADRIEDFYSEWRPSATPTPGVLWVPPRETSDTDPVVQRINQIVNSLYELDDGAFQDLVASFTRSR